MSDEKRLRHIFNFYPKDTDESKIQTMCVCYCRYCGEFVMILPYAFESFPIRKRDLSRVIEENKTDFKYNLYYGGDIYVRRDVLLERQCRYYCNHCKLLIAYRQAPPGEESKFMYIVRGSITTDPEIMLREVRNYKLQIPSYIQRDPEDPASSSVILLSVKYGEEVNCIAGTDGSSLIIHLKRIIHDLCSSEDVYADEGKSNSYLLQFISSLFHISNLDLSLLHISNQLAIRINGIDYEDMYLKVKPFVSE